jgi:hypothetical protein
MPQNGAIERALAVYRAYSSRADALAPVRAVLPATESVFGLVTYDDPEATLWRPFGKRRFEHVMAGDDRASIEAAGIKYLVVSEIGFNLVIKQPLAAWLADLDAEVVATVPIASRARAEPTNWRLVRLRPRPSAQSGRASSRP